MRTRFLRINRLTHNEFFLLEVSANLSNWVRILINITNMKSDINDQSVGRSLMEREVSRSGATNAFAGMWKRWARQPWWLPRGQQVLHQR